MVDEESKHGSAVLAPPAPRRFAPNAAKAAQQDGNGVKPAPSYVFLRVKRKRHEDPVESLLVHREPELKKQQLQASPAQSDAPQAVDTTEATDPRTQQRDLLDAFTKLSTKERGFVFTRIDTFESNQLVESGADGSSKWAERLKRKAKSMKANQQTTRVNAKKLAVEKTAQALTQNRVQQQQTRLKERRQSEVLRSRGLLAPMEMTEQKTHELSGLRMVDLMAVAPSSADSSSTLATGELLPSSGEVTMNGAKMSVKRVLNPYERELDEAVWTAFQQNDFSHFFRIFHAHRPELRVDPAAFQRAADGGSILMAAAAHGRADVIEAVLRSSATRVLQEDWNGATASAFARQHGHKNVEAALLACEEAEREKEYVYDVYCIDMAASEDRSAAVGGNTSDRQELSLAPVVSVSSAVQRWLSQEADQRVAAAAEDQVDEFMLESDNDNDLDDDGESIDSNHENHEFNDYPDEESSGSDYDSDDSDKNLRHRVAGTSSARHQRGGERDDQVCADEPYDY